MEMRWSCLKGVSKCIINTQQEKTHSIKIQSIINAQQEKTHSIKIHSIINAQQEKIHSRKIMLYALKNVFSANY